MQGKIRIKKGCVAIINRLYFHKIKLYLFIAFVCKRRVICIKIIFFDLKSWLIINLIYLFFFYTDRQIKTVLINRAGVELAKKNC